MWGCHLDLRTVKLLLKYCMKKYEGYDNATNENKMFTQCDEWQKKHFQSNGK